jgi:hypothetical protein
MIDKNYPMRKEKAKTFIAGLYDSPNVELVHIGFGRKSVEELMSGSFSASYPDGPRPDEECLVELTTHHLSINQCAQLFLAVGITSNNSHHVLNLSPPTLTRLSAHQNAKKICIMRSGGPFDARWGLECVAIDRYLSVQVQVPGAGVSTSGSGIAAAMGTGSRYAMSGAGVLKESEPPREREGRSFAPSPPSSSMRGLPVSESEKTAVMGDAPGRESGEHGDLPEAEDESTTTSAQGI